MLKPFSPLLDKASDDGKGSGGGGGGDQPAFTEAQTAELGKIVNAAVTSHIKRGLGPAIGEALKGFDFGAALKLDDVLDAKLEKLLADAGDDDAPGKPGNQPPKPDPKIAALEAKLAEVTGKLEAEAKARTEAEGKARDEKALAALKTALGPHVRPEALEIAASHLFVAQKRVEVDEAGNVLLKVRKAPFAGGAEEDVPMPLADGVQHWVKSSEGKFFAPAPASGGQGPAGGAPRRVNHGSDGLPVYDKPATTDAEKIRRAEERAQALQAKYPNL
jgi:hypothetical protein